MVKIEHIFWRVSRIIISLAALEKFLALFLPPVGPRKIPAKIASPAAE
jgi:hypothetical protein